jgi:hypothetical protein
MSRASLASEEALAQLALVRELLVLLGAVSEILDRDPSATGSEVAAVLRMKGIRRRQEVILAAVSALRTREPWRGRGRPPRGGECFSDRVQHLLGDAE